MAATNIELGISDRGVVVRQAGCLPQFLCAFCLRNTLFDMRLPQPPDLPAPFSVQ